MGKFDGILFCTDLDGTLFRNDYTISKENMDAIRYFKSEGGLFTFITGRVPMTARSIYHTVRPNAPCGCVNGAGIYDFQKETYLWQAKLPESGLELIEYIDRTLPAMGIQINTANNIYFSKQSLAMEWFRRATGVLNIMRHYRDIPEPILKVLFVHEDDKLLDETIRLLNEHPKAKEFDFIRSEKTMYEMLPKVGGKGQVLERMAGLLGIDMRRTVAVGNYENDISMIQKAGVGYAVENAINAVKEAADRITVSNQEHAIAKIISDLERELFTS